MKTRRTLLAVLGLVLCLSLNLNANDAIDDAINDVLSVEENGKGHVEAVKAMKTLQSATQADIPRLLSGMDKANKISANWLRGVIVATMQRDGEFPTAKVTEYFNDASHSHRGRLMAFELLCENDDEFAEKTIPTLISDTSLPLRRMGVDWYIKQAEESEEVQASMGALGYALEKARDIDQVMKISEMMGEKGISIDLQSQLGFINHWHIVGNFNNKDEGGFDVAYGPEKKLGEINVAEDIYEDLNGDKVSWSPCTTIDPTGVVDLVDKIGPIKGVTAYAYATFNAAEAREVDIRVGCINAHKVWVNGELVMSNEVYHNGMSADKFSSSANLKEGENVILIKVCQNEQREPWAQDWQFQVRVCDETGKAIKPAKEEEAEEF